MMQSLAAIFLLRCLKAKNYYPVEPNADPTLLSDTEMYLSLLIHHFMRVTYYNTHEVTTTDEDTNGVGFGTDRLAMRRIGRATNPTLALLNHTCDPNYRRISVGRQVKAERRFSIIRKFCEKWVKCTRAASNVTLWALILFRDTGDIFAISWDTFAFPFSYLVNFIMHFHIDFLAENS